MDPYRLAPPCPRPVRPSTLSVRIGYAWLVLAPLVTACTPGAAPVVAAGVDAGIGLADALCEEDVDASDPAWLQFVCKVIDPSSGKTLTVKARVAKSDTAAVAAMRARKCPAGPPGKVTP